MDVKLPMTGSCQCGNIRYRVTEAPLVAVACHCDDCRKLSGSVYGTVLVLAAAALVVEGDLRVWQRIAASGRRNNAHFCPICGNRIYHQDPDAPHIKRIRSGTLDGVEIPEPRIHVFTSRKQSWVTIPDGTIQFDEQPDADQLYEAMAAMAGDSR